MRVPTLTLRYAQCIANDCVEGRMGTASKHADIANHFDRIERSIGGKPV